jgi:hypothetical protein
MEVIAADSGEEDKSEKPARWRRSQQQPGRLPNHQNRAYGNIKTAEDEIIDYFPEHLVN